MSNTNANLSNLAFSLGFEGSNLTGVNLTNSSGVSFDNQTILSNGIIAANLAGTGADLTTLAPGSDLRGVNMTGCSLNNGMTPRPIIDKNTILSDGATGANVALLDLSNLDLTGVDFRNVNLSKRTSNSNLSIQI